MSCLRDIYVGTEFLVWWVSILWHKKSDYQSLVLYTCFTFLFFSDDQETWKCLTLKIKIIWNILPTHPLILRWKFWFLLEIPCLREVLQTQKHQTTSQLPWWPRYFFWCFPPNLSPSPLPSPTSPLFILDILLYLC